MTSPKPRSATADDITSIQRLLLHYSAMGDLLPRTTSDLAANLSHFQVIDGAEGLTACGSLEHFTPELAEIRSLMVDENHKGQGLGKVIVVELIKRAKASGTQRLMALTYVPEFFHQLGFQTVSKEIFPEKIWGICVNCYKFHKCDEIAVLLELN